MTSSRPDGTAKIALSRAVLVIAPSRYESTIREIEMEMSALRKVEAEAGCVLELENGEPERVEIYTEPEEAVLAIRRAPVNVVVVDNRDEEYTGHGFAGTRAGRLVPKLLSSLDDGRAPNRSLIFVILPDFEATAHHAFTVGALQLGGVIIEPPSVLGALRSAFASVRPPDSGKVALCLAGGGIEGMVYEIGALRALDSHLKGRSVIEFDIFSGISAGAILGAFLANGILPVEMSNAAHGRPSRVSAIGRGLLFDPNLGEIVTRVIGAAGDLVRGNWLKRPLEAAMKVTPSAFFSGDRLKWHLEKELTKPGLTNDFNKLKKELFVGVTDQDTGEHVTFGEEGMKDVPISHVLRASAAMTPYYPPEMIKGRYYIDGIFTRTVNLDVAVAHGARLIVCVDPLTPVQVDEPGYVRDRGGFFNTVQSVKSLIRTRLSEVLSRAGEAHPNVGLCVFSPTRQDLERMSVTMMRYGSPSEIEQMSFESVSNRIQLEYDWLAADFERYGFELSPVPVK